MVSFCCLDPPAPIVIDSDAEGSSKKDDSTSVARPIKRKPGRKRLSGDRRQLSPVRRSTLCFCTSIYCRNCLNEGTRKKLFQMYSCHPIYTTHIKMCENVADLINLPKDKVRRIFTRLQTYMQMVDGDLPTPQMRKALTGYEHNFPRSLAPLELCLIKRKLLLCKPGWFGKTLTTSCRIFRYKISAAAVVETLATAGKLRFRRIVNRISKKSKLIAVEDSQLRVDRVAYIRGVQSFRRANRRIIYCNAIMIGDKMIVIAADSNGPITTAFIANTDAHEFIKWFAKDIVANLKESSVFVFGPSCTFRSQANVPLETDSHDTLVAWLQARRAAHEATMLRTELFELVRQQCAAESAESGYIINQYLARTSHEVLHIPMENRDLDPFEYIWFQIKLRMIANGTGSFNINKQLCSLSTDVWKEQFERIQAIEKVYTQIERNFDRTYRRFRVDNHDFKSDDIAHGIDTVYC